jgi:hypothetical protein
MLNAKKCIKGTLYEILKMEVKKGEGERIKNLNRFSLNFLRKSGEGIL